MADLSSSTKVPFHSPWVLASGLLLILIGLLALLFSGISTLASVALLGSLLIVRGVMEIFLSSRLGRQSGLGYHFFLGLLSLVVGAFILWDPLGNTVVLTLLIGLFFFLNGLARVAVSLINRHGHWGKIAAGGAISMILGGIVFWSWPVSSFWTIGTLVGADLMAFGVVLTSAALSGRAPQDWEIPPSGRTNSV